jgi:hypothetical protein
MQTLLCKFPTVVPALMNARREMLSTVLPGGGALPSLKEMLGERGRPWTELFTAPCQFHGAD